MVRLVFGNKENFEDWASQNSEKLEAFCSEDGLIVLSPTVSTRPIKTGIMFFGNIKEREEVMERIRSFGISIVDVKSIVWDVESRMK